ncbi:MAG: Lrp/AsnC family transcriptional regulator [Chloroflexi bacterium]|nr:MAG: Lrp/AsnC family transcriptional regulator [Chloroflexota bacterium]
MITAVVLITAEKGALPKLGEALAAIEGVSEVYSVTGDFDFVAMVRAREHDELADIVTQRIAQVADARHPLALRVGAPAPSHSCRRLLDRDRTLSRRHLRVRGRWLGRTGLVAQAHRVRAVRWDHDALAGGRDGPPAAHRLAGVAVRRRYFTLRSGDAPHRSAALARRAFAFQQLDRVRCRRVQLDGRARRVRLDRDLRDDDLDIHVLARPRKHRPGHPRRNGLPDDRAGPRFHDRDQRPGRR